jgi:hypothetical protein
MTGSIGQRSFLVGFAAVVVAAHVGVRAEVGAREAGPGRRTDLKVTNVQVLQVTGKNKRKALYVMIQTDSGIAGLYGPIDSEADSSACRSGGCLAAHARRSRPMRAA